MRQETIETNLCVHDRRSDDYKSNMVRYGYSHEDMANIKANHCCCANCESGRNKLALEIIRLNKRIIKLKESE